MKRALDLTAAALGLLALAPLFLVVAVWIRLDSPGPAKIALSREYVRKRSLWMDLRLIGRTVLGMLPGRSG